MTNLLSLPSSLAAPTRFVIPAVSQTASQREELITPGKMLWLLSSPPCSSFMQRWQRLGKLSQLMCHQPLSAAKRSSVLPLSHVFCAGSSIVWGRAAADNDFRKIQGRSTFEPLLFWCSCAACALQGSCVSTEVWSIILPVTSGREFQSYQYRSVLCHMEQAKVLSAYLEICC